MSTTTSVARFLYSVLVTLVLLIISVLLLHETHQVSSIYVQRTTLMSILAILCPLLSISTYLSPIGSVILMVKNHDDSNFPIEVIAAQTANNVACAAYGLQIGDEPFFLSSFVGLAFQFVWLTMWFWVVTRRGNRRLACNLNRVNPVLFSMILGSVLSTAIFTLTLVDKDFNGTTCVILTFLLGISPLAKLGLVIRQRDTSSIPIAMSIVMLFTNVAWAMYGVILEDSYIVIPSVFGFVICVFQLIVAAWCNEFLFYDLTFLEWIFKARQNSRYISVEGSVELRRFPSASSSVFGPPDD